MKTILVLHSSADLYGSDRSLLRLVTGGLPYRFIVAVPYEGPLCERLREAGVRVEIWPLAVVRRQYFSPIGLVKLKMLMLASIYRMARFCRREGVSAVLSNTTAVLGGTQVALLAGVPHVQYVREIIERPRMVGRLLAFLAWGSRRIVCVSEGTRRPFVYYWRPNASRAVVIHNGIHTEQFQNGHRGETRDRFEIPDSTFVFGFLGRISPFKGADVFVKAAADFLTRVPDARVAFVIVGSAFTGQEWREKEVEEKIRETGHGERFIRLPFQTEVADLLAAFDAVVVPSVHPDPFPTVVLESMAAGRPVIGTAIGGVPEMIVDGETGYLVEPGDATALADRMERFFRKPSRAAAMGAAGAQRCRERFSVDGYLGTIGNLLEEVLSRRH